MRCVIEIDPMPAPRMNYRSKATEKAKKYFAFRNEFILKAKVKGLKDLPDVLDVVFFIPMPKSWSKAKRNIMNGKPHQQKPDLDNLLKSVQDAFNKDDSHVWGIRSRKFWSDKGMIVIDAEAH